MKVIDLEAELSYHSDRGKGVWPVQLIDEDGRNFEIVDVGELGDRSLIVRIRPAGDTPSR